MKPLVHPQLFPNGELRPARCRETLHTGPRSGEPCGWLLEGPRATRADRARAHARNVHRSRVPRFQPWR